jgi:hypothetical protein
VQIPVTDEIDFDENYYVTSVAENEVSDADSAFLSKAVARRFDGLELVIRKENGEVHFAFDPDKTERFAKPLSQELELFIDGFLQGRKSV